VLEHHAHLAGEWTERAVIELDHGALSNLFDRRAASAAHQ
jgi:hypothetical protein